MFLERLRCFVVRACDLSTGEPASSTHSTLVHPLVRANHLVAARLHTLALDTHRCGVRAAGRPINHLQGHNNADFVDCRLLGSYRGFTSHSILGMTSDEES